MTNPRKGSRAINPPADSPLNPRFDEGGMNFQTGGKFQRWALWSVILLTLPQFLSWFAAQGISMPPQGRKYQQSVGRERGDEPYWVCRKRDRGQASPIRAAC